MSEESCHLVRRRTSPPPGAVFQARFLDNPRGRQHLTKRLRKALSEMCPKPTFFWHRHLFQLWRYRAWEISPRVCDIRRGIHTVIRFWLTGWAHQPLHQSTIASINHCMYRPLQLSTIASINHCIYQPLHLSIIASINDCIYQPLHQPLYQQLYQPLHQPLQLRNYPTSAS